MQDKKCFPGLMKLLLAGSAFFCLPFGGCAQKKTIETAKPAAPATVEMWLTKGDQSVLLQEQNKLAFSNPSNNNPFIDVDSSTAMQDIDGFGYTLTGGSAELIHKMDAVSRAALLTELFGNTGASLNISYLRISIGASDLSSSVFSYDDLLAGETDTALTRFNLSLDTSDLIPVLKQILSINPDIKILGSPWSPPVWMKDNGSSIGGSLLPQYYSVYAKYFIKYIQQMQAQGIRIDAITPQNEPQHGGNNPSMVLSSQQEGDFIKNHLGPAFRVAGIATKIIIWDHNCDNPGYPIAILNDAAAKPFIDGSAFHLYNGDISALSTVYNAHPDKHLYFTEQWTSSQGSFDGDLKWHVKNVIIGSMRNYSRVALEWNLANDPAFRPFTPGGCTQCKGALTIFGSSATRNVSYYIIAHASKFVPPGSVRIGSNIQGGLQNVCFKTPQGKKVMLVVNEGSNTAAFNIRYQGNWTASELAGGAVATYRW